MQIQVWVIINLTPEMRIKVAILLLSVLVWVAQNKLYQIISIFRHGARYHTNSIYDGNSTLPMKSELTPIGMRQHQNFGKLIREQYIEKEPLLSPLYNKSEIEIFSTDYNRTLESATSHMYGLYPLGNGPKLPYVDRPYHLPPYSTNQVDIKEQNFALPLGLQPIQVQVDPKVMLADCDNWDELVEKSKQRSIVEYNQMNMTYYPFLKKLATIFMPNKTALTIEQVDLLYDTLQVDKYLGRSLPTSISESDFKNIVHLHNWYYTMIQTNQLAHMSNTYKFKKIISSFDTRTRLPQTFATKMIVMSAHDTDTVPLLTDMNITSYQCIEDLYRNGKTDALNCQTELGFGSNIIIELHSDDKLSFKVRVRSNGRYVKMCGTNKIQCDYLDWKARVKKTMITNVQEICHN